MFATGKREYLALPKSESARPKMRRVKEKRWVMYAQNGIFEEGNFITFFSVFYKLFFMRASFLKVRLSVDCNEMYKKNNLSFISDIS